jgi:hypothetical protein
LADESDGLRGEENGILIGIEVLGEARALAFRLSWGRRKGGKIGEGNAPPYRFGFLSPGTSLAAD